MDKSVIDKIYAGYKIKRKRVFEPVNQKAYNDSVHKASMLEVYRIIRNNPKISRGELYLAANVSAPTARKCIKELIGLGKIIERTVMKVRILEAIA